MAYNHIIISKNPLDPGIQNVSRKIKYPYKTSHRFFYIRHRFPSRAHLRKHCRKTPRYDRYPSKHRSDSNNYVQCSRKSHNDPLCSTVARNFPSKRSGPVGFLYQGPCYGRWYNSYNLGVSKLTIITLSSFFLFFARSRGGGGSINPFEFTLLLMNLDSIASSAAADAIELLPRCLHLRQTSIFHP